MAHKIIIFILSVVCLNVILGQNGYTFEEASCAQNLYEAQVGDPQHYHGLYGGMGGMFKGHGSGHHHHKKFKTGLR